MEAPQTIAPCAQSCATAISRRVAVPIVHASAITRSKPMSKDMQKTIPSSEQMGQKGSSTASAL